MKRKHGQREGTGLVDKKECECVKEVARWGGRGQLPAINQPILCDILNLHLALNWIESLGWAGC